MPKTPEATPSGRAAPPPGMRAVTPIDLEARLADAIAP
jgi:hypothetical protein